MDVTARTRPVIVRVAVAALIVVASATVLWMRQNDRALLGVDSYTGALAEVAFWAAPTLLLFVGLIRNTIAVGVVGAALAVLSSAVWWGSATDWHSTASLGPGLCGWFLGPAVVGAGAAASRWRSRARHS